MRDPERGNRGITAETPASETEAETQRGRGRARKQRETWKMAKTD